jgi:hypothetical protein
MSGTPACLSLLRSSRFCLDLPKLWFRVGNVIALALLQFVPFYPAPNGIKFSHLNWNLMALKSRPPTLHTSRNSCVADNVFSVVRSIIDC